jgi:hypothetical protein
MGQIHLGTRATARTSGGAAAWIVAGLAIGLTLGFVTWSAQQDNHRRALFHASPRRRLAALGYLRAHPSVDSARLLRDYLRWEPLPLLRRRARGVLRRTERLLRS